MGWTRENGADSYDPCLAIPLASGRADSCILRASAASASVSSPHLAGPVGVHLGYDDRFHPPFPADLGDGVREIERDVEILKALDDIPLEAGR